MQRGFYEVNINLLSCYISIKLVLMITPRTEIVTKNCVC